MKRETYIAKTFGGLEEVLASEIKDLGGTNIEIKKRAVLFSGNIELLYTCNLCLRTALKILKPISGFQAIRENELYNKAKKIKWEEILSIKKTFVIESTVNSRYFSHSKYCALKLKDAIVDRFRDKFHIRPSVEKNSPDFKIHLHISDNNCSLYLDSSGEPLFKRGYRRHTNEAPLNEVLAAGLILLSGWKGDSDFIDPMCGSGTIPIEASLWAMNIPPCFGRKEFAFMKWPDFNIELWKTIRSNSLRSKKAHSFSFFLNDSNAEAIKKAKKNIENPGLQGNQFYYSNLSFEKYMPETKNAFMVFNPPYGERMGGEDMISFYSMIGDILKKRFTGTEAWIITGNLKASKHFGLKPSKKITLFNGPIECRFIQFKLYKGSKKSLHE